MRLALHFAVLCLGQPRNPRVGPIAGAGAANKFAIVKEKTAIFTAKGTSLSESTVRILRQYT